MVDENQEPIGFKWNILIHKGWKTHINDATLGRSTKNMHFIFEEDISDEQKIYDVDAILFIPGAMSDDNETFEKMIKEFKKFCSFANNVEHTTIFIWPEPDDTAFEDMFTSKLRANGRQFQELHWIENMTFFGTLFRYIEDKLLSLSWCKPAKI